MSSAKFVEACCSQELVKPRNQCGVSRIFRLSEKEDVISDATDERIALFKSNFGDVYVKE